MIWIFVFYFFLLLSAKKKVFLSSMIDFDLSTNFMVSVIPLSCSLIFMMMWHYSDHSDQKVYKLCFSSLFLILFFNFIIKSPLMFLAMLELTVVPMVILIYSFSKDKDKNDSVLMMLGINMVGSVPFMQFCASGTWTTQHFLHSFSSYEMNLFLDPLIMVSLFILLVSKVPIFLLHFWLTKAHVTSAGSCSMILASLMLKLGSFGLFKFSSSFVPVSLKYINLIISISIWSTLIFNFMMLRFSDLKLIVASSSIVHMSMIFPFCIFNSNSSMIPCLYIMVSHSLISYLLFFLVTSMYEMSMGRSIEMNKSISSMSSTYIFMIFLLFLVNMGIPPFVSFISEVMFLGSVLKISLMSSIIFSLQMVLSMLVTFFLMSKLVFGKKLSIVSFKENVMVLDFSLVFVFLILILPILK